MLHRAFARTVVLLASVVFFRTSAALARQDGPPAIESLRTVAESSGYKATSTYAQVVQMIDAFVEHSSLARRIDIGETVEHRAIPMLIIADPPIASAEEAAESGKMVVLMIGDIHAGEVAGKEALLMLARQILAGQDRDLLEHLVLCFVPIYNADGNERFSTENRPGQIGPEKGMGVRTNAQGLDLNRDFTKLDASESQALVRVMRRWDPSIFIDTHTTDGSQHRYLITYTGPKAPAGDRELIDYAHDTMMPRISEALRQRTGYESFFYGNFDRDHTQWESFPAEGRYGTTYFGLRNRISILCEAYAYASYRDRVLGSLEFVRQCLRDVNDHRGEIKANIIAADRRAEQRGPSETIALRTRAVVRPEKVTLLGYVEREGGSGDHSATEPCNYLVDLVDDFEPTLEVPLPAAYLLESTQLPIVRKLQQHGIAVDVLREDITLNVEIDRITHIGRARRGFQNRVPLTYESERQKSLAMIPTGTYVVRTDQPLGRLAAYLLEVHSEDGLAQWGFFEQSVRENTDYPVYRLLDFDEPLLTTPYRLLDVDRPSGQIVTEETLSNRRGMPSLSGNAINVVRWIDDTHYLVSKGGSLRQVEALTGRSQPYEEEPGFDSGPIAAALATLPTIDDRTARSLANRARFSMDAAQTGAFFNYQNDLYYAAADGSVAKRLTSTPDDEELASISPDGQFVAFVRSNDLFVVDVATVTERALTTGGSDILRRGKADWVYYEEIFNRNWRTYWWSPDSSRLAFLEMDSSMVPEFTITNNAQYQQRVETARYPKPGQPNPVVRLATVTVAGGEPQWVDLSGYEDSDRIISEVGWWPDSQSVYFYAQNRVQTWLDFCRVSADGGEPARLWRDQTKAWITSPGAPRFLDDGGFLLTSERTGWKQWYRYDASGSELGPVTSGEGEAGGVERFDEANNVLYVMGNHANAIGSDLYRFDTTDVSGTRLTNGRGSHNVSISPGGSYFIDSWSSFDQTPRVELRDGATGDIIRRVDINPVYALEEWNLGREVHAQIQARDGFPLDLTVLYPANFDPRKQRYPVWFTTYGGPHAPTISDRWPGGRLRDQVFVNQGIVLVKGDPRSASERGAQSTWTAYKQLGVQETLDIEDIIHWVTKQPGIDANRVGMTGHSYGGFMTAYAMTHSDVFSCGIAGAPPTDWREYDSIYTERYMDTPQNNPEGYDAASVITAAKNLHGRLRLLHGTIDDNVHMQNTIRLVKAFQDADVDFELMIFPGFRHGIFSRYYSRTMNEFILDALEVEPEDAADYERAKRIPKAHDGWYNAGD